MAFSQSTKDQALARSGSRCECTRQHAGQAAAHHGGRCATTLGRWEAHHKTALSSGGSDALSNCEVLCISCHQLTATYGG